MFAMEDQTAWVFALQMVALCTIAVALLLYLARHLVCNWRVDTGGAAVLVTTCDGALGLQLARHLDRLGFRVFAGFRDPGGEAGRVLAAAASPRLRILTLDVTREDHLHDAVEFIRKHLPAGEEGLWAVINTAGVCCRGRLEAQDVALWDAMLKLNVVGTLRSARTFIPLLKNKRGRLINLGASVRVRRDSGLVAYTSVRFAVEGASAALRQEVAPLGIHVLTLQPEDILPEKLFAAPRLGCSSGEHTVNLTQAQVMEEEEEEEDEEGRDFVREADRLLDQAIVLPPYAMRTVEEALLARTPRESYTLSLGVRRRLQLACSSSAMSKLTQFLHRHKLEQQPA